MATSNVLENMFHAVFSKRQMIKGMFAFDELINC